MARLPCPPLWPAPHHATLTGAQRSVLLVQGAAKRVLREFGAQQVKVIAETQEVLRRKGKGILAPVLPLYFGAVKDFDDSCLVDKLDAFVAVHDLTLGQALVEIQDAGHTLAADVVAKLLKDKDLQPRPTTAELALIRSMADKVGDGKACSDWGTVLGQLRVLCLR